MTATIHNDAAPGIPYFTPKQSPASGTAIDPQPNGKAIPKLFQPLKLRGVTLQNRIMLSPLCQYSADNGHFTSWHMAHLGGIISRGPGLSFIEATAVTPSGRITPQDSGIWLDSQAEALKEIVTFAHSQNQLIGIQLAHAGRKASTVAPWLSMGALATKEAKGWPEDVHGASAIPFNENHAEVKEMSKKEIESFKQAWVAGVKRAVAVGFDVIEIHNAHGYLLHSFCSGVSNNRTDEYGGSFENRIRLSVEIAELTRANIPDTMPLVIRVSGTDWLPDVEGSWTVDDTVRFAEVLATKGVDLIDTSSGGAHPKQQPKTGPGYQAPLAMAIKKKLGNKIAVGAVGVILSGKQADELLEDGLDLVAIGRPFQKNPGLVWTFAEELGCEIKVANQIEWGFAGRGSSGKK